MNASMPLPSRLRVVSYPANSSMAVCANNSVRFWIRPSFAARTKSCTISPPCSGNWAWAGNNSRSKYSTISSKHCCANANWRAVGWAAPIKAASPCAQRVKLGSIPGAMPIKWPITKAGSGRAMACIKSNWLGSCCTSSKLQRAMSPCIFANCAGRKAGISTWRKRGWSGASKNKNARAKNR